MDITFIREKIKLLRRTKGITQKEMGNRLYMDERSYAKIERGEKKSIDILLLTSIADKLNVDIEILLGKESPPPAEHVNDALTDLGINSLIESQKALREEIQQLKDQVKIMITNHQEALRILRQSE
jgi:transcriptional regulator with XRE-family HTH domain